MKLSGIQTKCIALFLFALILSSCKKKLFTPEWDSKILTPVAHSKMGIKDLVKNNKIIKSDSNQLLSIAYTNAVYKLSNPLDSLISLSIAPFSKIVTLETLALGNQKISDSLKLGDLISQIPPGFPISLPDGSSIPSFWMPLLNNIITNANTTSSQVDISEFLVEAYLKQAFFDLSIRNKTNFEILGLKYKVKNTEDETILLEGVIDSIKPNETFTELNIDVAAKLAGKPVKGLLTIESGGFTLGIPIGQNVAQINYSDFLAFSATLRDIKVLKANAQFPAQEVVNNTGPIDLKAEDGVELTFAKIDTGIVNIKGYSSIPVDIHFTYSVPNLSQNGNTFSVSSTLDDTYNSYLNQGDTNFYFNNFDFDLTLPQAPYFKNFNASLNSLVATIDSTKGVLPISLEDTINLTISVTKIRPSYARGFLGSKKVSIKQKVKFDAFSKITGKINFEKIKLELFILNEIGVEASLKINSITAKNTKSGLSEMYTGATSVYTINKATEVGDKYKGRFTIIDLANSENLFSIFPDEFEIDFELLTNPNGNNFSYKDFIHSGASITAGLNLELPLVASVEGLILQDTADFSLDNVEIPTGFKNGIFSIIADNGFPLDIDLDVFFLNNADIVIDSLSSDKLIQSATIDPSSKVVAENVKTKLDYTFDNFDLNALTSAEKIVFKAKFDSKNKEQVKFYDFYTLELKLIADFNYHISTAK